MSSLKELQDNAKLFNEMIQQLNIQNEQLATLVGRYLEQNIMVLNDVYASSIENLKRLQLAKSSNDIICTQARFTNEISKKLSLSAQRFLNASLGHIADYNDWLKAHCDLSTD